MTTDQSSCRWQVSEDSAGLFPIAAGTAPTARQSWEAAFAAGSAALLGGAIQHMAIAVDNELPTLIYSPGRDDNGRLTPAFVADDLASLRHDVLVDLARTWVPAGTLGTEDRKVAVDLGE